ncbi:MAG: hypothetical protein HYZ39_19250 [Mycolicibacterium cosmeticum]|nr:hypothetical protein [Mycolicibacterium cosmeticum]
MSHDGIGADDVRRAMYGTLPPSVRIEETITSQETAPVPNTEIKRDPECEFIRFT